MVGDAQDIFTVEENTGVIRTLAKVDREAVSQYSLLLEARDSSLTEPRSATTEVNFFQVQS